MWVLFVASLGIAGVLSNRKPTARRVSLISEPRRFGDLVVHTPAGWNVASDTADSRHILLMQENGDPSLRGCAIVVQTVESGAVTSKGYLLDVTSSSTDSFSEFTFKHLGGGVTAEVDAPDSLTGMEEPSVCASIVVPRPNAPGESLAVLVTVYRPGPVDSEDAHLLQSIADQISVSAKSTSRPDMESD